MPRIVMKFGGTSVADPERIKAVALRVKREVDAVMRNQAERILRDLDVVKREEFEAVKDMARLAREENEALKARIAALEAKLEKPGKKTATPPE